MKRNLTKESVLDILKNNSTQYISGEEIANSLFITRSAVWKSIKSLREEGLNIEAVSNKGYRLIYDSDIISSVKIRSYLDEKYRDMVIKCHETVESTNDLAHEWGRCNNSECVILANEQTKGRGRRGREFYSPKATGLYLSLCLFPDTNAEKATLLTCLAAVAVCRALEEVAHIKPQIKWVNDIFYNGKKVAGILTEAISSIEDGNISYAVVGIGVNLYDPIKGFPEEIRKIAGSVYTKGGMADDVRNRIAARIIAIFLDYYKNDWSNIIDEYRSRSFLIGKTIIVHPSGINNSKEKIYAKATGIDDKCHLLVEYEDGRHDALSTGEVSVVGY